MVQLLVHVHVYHTCTHTNVHTHIPSSFSLLPPNMESCPNPDRNSNTLAQHAWLLAEKGTYAERFHVCVCNNYINIMHRQAYMAYIAV